MTKLNSEPFPLNRVGIDKEAAMQWNTGVPSDNRTVLVSFSNTVYAGQYDRSEEIWSIEPLMGGHHYNSVVAVDGWAEVPKAAPIVVPSGWNAGYPPHSNPVLVCLFTDEMQVSHTTPDFPYKWKRYQDHVRWWRELPEVKHE